MLTGARGHLWISLEDAALMDIDLDFPRKAKSITSCARIVQEQYLTGVWGIGRRVWVAVKGEERRVTTMRKPIRGSAKSRRQ